MTTSFRKAYGFRSGLLPMAAATTTTTTATTATTDTTATAAATTATTITTTNTMITIATPRLFSTAPRSATLSRNRVLRLS